MAYKFEGLLLKEKIQQSELSTSLKKKIADLLKVETAIPAAEDRLKNGNLSVKKKEELQAKITDSKAAIPDMDAEIVEGINKWIPKRATFAAQGQRLKESRANAGGKSAGTTDPAPAAPAPSSTTATPVKQTKQQVPAVTKEEEKKGMSGWGWLLMGIGTIALAFVGVQVHKAYKDSKAA